MFLVSRTSVFILLFCFAFGVSAQDKASTLLRKGWIEYRFQEVKKARSYFEDAEKVASGNKDELLQALTGQAFCFQFLMKNSVTADDFTKASILYDRCIKEAGPAHRNILFWKSMKAECLYRLSLLDSDIDEAKEAEDLWLEVLDKDPASVFSQDAMLSRAIMQSANVNDAKVTSHCADLEKYLVPARKTGGEIDIVKDTKSMLAPVMATYLYNVYYYRGEFRRSVDALIDYCKFGPTSFQYKATAYFKVARMSETRLSDKATAVEYYRKFYKECGSDSRSYYAKEREEMLGSAKSAEPARDVKEGR